MPMSLTSTSTIPSNPRNDAGESRISMPNDDKTNAEIAMIRERLGDLSERVDHLLQWHSLTEQERNDLSVVANHIDKARHIRHNLRNGAGESRES